MKNFFQESFCGTPFPIHLYNLRISIFFTRHPRYGFLDEIFNTSFMTLETFTLKYEMTEKANISTTP